MPCSPAQLKANRENAKRSTGPRTAAGKARSRSNNFKHGLTGTGVALPVEDQAEVERRFRALGDDLGPRDEGERLLVKRAAFLSVRLERCERFETAGLTEAIRTAVADHDDRILDEVDEAIARLADEPRAAVRRLCRTPDGLQ